MGLQQQIAEAIMIAIDELGGDPQGAIDAALRHKDVDSWLSQETTKIAFAGGAEMIIPGIQGLTIPAGISYLLHKMAHISWGIGALKGAYITETVDYSDLRNILALWANASYYNASILEYRAISLRAFTYALTQDGNDAITSRIQSAAGQDDHVMTNTLYVLRSLAGTLADDERAITMMRSLVGTDATDDALMLARERAADMPESFKERQEINARISTRLAGRLAAQISARVPARLVMGFIPIAGAVVNAIFNAQTLRSMANTAEKYYDKAVTRQELETLLVQPSNPGAES
jgi:hypothetical protein